MSLIVSIAVVLIFLILIAQQIKYLKKLRIATKKTYFDRIVYVIGILVFIVITLLYGKNFIHYLVATLGIVFFTLEFLTQGILEDGIAFIAKGKQTCKWSEILQVKIVKSKDLKVIYWSREGQDIIHNFTNDRCEEIVDLCIKNHIKFDIKYN